MTSKKTAIAWLRSAIICMSLLVATFAICSILSRNNQNEVLTVEAIRSAGVQRSSHSKSKTGSVKGELDETDLKDLDDTFVISHQRIVDVPPTRYAVRSQHPPLTTHIPVSDVSSFITL